MSAQVSYFGIRHHGPGSARRLAEALDALAPSVVLIEGPADASSLLPMLADPAMVLPVALVTYAEDDPSRATFFPFAQYSPEYQAACWAVRHGAELRFIDLPASDRLSQIDDHESDAPPVVDDAIARDPIGALASAAGYDDGESWWRDVIEENPSASPIFSAVADAMTALRAETETLSAHEAAREAHMRLEVARAVKEHEGAIAVVCGAWHVPALLENHAQSADRDILKGRQKSKIKATWAPWTEPRLSFASGYGAGVAAPGWCKHVWEAEGSADSSALWLARIAQLMRDKGHFVSTASVIEASRLGTTLAAMRERPAPGFEELRDAAIACLCFGERLLWDQIATDLLIGSGVGAIPENTPLAPLLEDLQRQQRLTKLKPEALERDLAVDLRSDSGLARSTLLHRLTVLDVPWGRLADAGKSRGTFREKWTLCWEPEFAVRLVENLVYGATIADAATGRILAAIKVEPHLAALAELVRQAMVADLPDAVDQGITVLERKAALTSDCLSLLAALPPMADIVRYGEARAGAAEHLAELMPRLAVQAALALPYAARNLDTETAGLMRSQILAADSAIHLAEMNPDVVQTWQQALRQSLNDGQVARLIAGLSARVLYAADQLSADEAAVLLGKMLSPGSAIADAAAFFDGFFDGAGERLIHDAPLREAVDGWLVSLEEEDFVTHLPLFRRVFSVLDRAERRRLMDALFDRAKSGHAGYRLITDADAIWPRHFDRVTTLLDAGIPK
jgi:Family of unknown function (DUF5682)